MLRPRFDTDPIFCTGCFDHERASHIVETPTGAQLPIGPACLSLLALDLSHVTVADLELAAAASR